MHEDLLKFFLELNMARSLVKIGQFFNFKNWQVAREYRPISRKHGGLLKFFLEFEKW